MAFRDKERAVIRKCNLEWHCHEIKIHQSKLDDGYVFEGYGIVKSADNGGLYLDFICKKSNKIIDFRTPIPEDSLDERQVMTMKALTIDGVELCSSGLRIESDFQKSLSEDPKLYKIGLSYIEFSEETDLTYNKEKTLYLEFNEECRIPKNKLNKTESTLGVRSSSWNQTVLNYEDFEINIIRHEDYTEVSANGNSIDLDKLRNAITFYLSFSSGVYIQPYFEYKREGACSVTEIRSIDRKKINNSIPAPVCDLVHDQNKVSLENLHFELFDNIYFIITSNDKVFDSIYSQWKRIWHSFLSPEISVPMLTISVAIEGVLNDIFIPKLSSDLRDESFEDEKSNIIDELEKNKAISNDHIESLTKYVEKWGNVHARKALNYLVDKNVIEKRQVNNWSDLRNSSAHPKLMKQDEGRKKKDLTRTIICLGLFYRLTLNVFAYKGAQYAYEKPKDNKLVIYEYVNVLH
ncbi:MAG: hypothetical protein OQK32_02650 [Gammaproteobacteria bacterium]|nr:hypothetical protein [Gammaproteobacteria bacterium]MCW8922520.1 hypothetical protein [Gammaproteobacteria bacterium]